MGNQRQQGKDEEMLRKEVPQLHEEGRQEWEEVLSWQEEEAQAWQEEEVQVQARWPQEVLDPRTLLLLEENKRQQGKDEEKLRKEVPQLHEEGRQEWEEVLPWQEEEAQAWQEEEAQVQARWPQEVLDPRTLLLLEENQRQ